MTRIHIALCAFLLASAASILGATFTVQAPTADAFATGGSADPDAGNPNGNYGAAGALQISAPGAAKGEMQSVLKFDLAPAKASFDATFGAGNWMVDNITLQLGTNFGKQGQQPNNPIFNSINAGLFKVGWFANDNYAEGTGNPSAPFFPSNPPVDGVTFNSLPSLLGVSDELLGAFTFSPTPAADPTPPTFPPATYSLSLQPGFVADVSAGNNVSLRGYADTGSVSYLFNSRSFGTVANRPQLIVSASTAPEPGAGLLLAGAAGAWLARRRRDARAA